MELLQQNWVQPRVCLRLARPLTSGTSGKQWTAFLSPSVTPCPHERLSLRAWPSDGELIRGRDLRRAPFREGGLADPNPHDSEESGSNYSLRMKDLGSFPVETVKCQPHGNSGSLIK